MKVKDIIEQMPLDPESCELCELHDKANILIPNGFECPHCGHINHPDAFLYNIDDADNYEFTVVGIQNSVEMDDDIHKMCVSSCTNCNKHFALLPIKIIWNAGHDVYYTGAGNYLNKDIELDRKELIEAISNYTDRIREDEKNLEPKHLLIWIERVIERNVAKYLEEIGVTHLIERGKNNE